MIKLNLFHLLHTHGLGVIIVVTSPFLLIMLAMIGKCCLKTQEVVSSHTAQNLAEEIHYSLDKWDITDKVVMVTTDNAQNIRNAIIDQLHFSHLGCVGHTLQLDNGKALQLTPVSRVLGRVRKLVEHFISLL